MHVRKTRVVVGNGEDVVLLALRVGYVQGSYGTSPHHAAGESGIVGGHHYVQGVAATGQRGGYEAVVGGVADGARQNPIPHDDPKLGLVLVLVAAAQGNLNDGVDQLRGFFSDRQSFEVGFHWPSLTEVGLLTLTIAQCSDLLLLRAELWKIQLLLGTGV